MVDSHLASFGLQAFHSEHVVDRSFLWIIQDIVGLLHLDEDVHRQLLSSKIRVLVRMIDQCESTVRLLDVRRICLEQQTVHTSLA